MIFPGKHVGALDFPTLLNAASAHHQPPSVSQVWPRRWGGIPTGDSAVPVGSTEAKTSDCRGAWKHEPPSEHRVRQMTEVSAPFSRSCSGVCPGRWKFPDIPDSGPTPSFQGGKTNLKGSMTVDSLQQTHLNGYLFFLLDCLLLKCVLCVYFGGLGPTRATTHRFGS